MEDIRKPIDVIVIFVDREIPEPRKFRYKNEDGDYHRINIEKILYTAPIDAPGVRGYLYECESTIGCNRYRYQLVYNMLSGSCWQLYKGECRG